MPPLISQPYLLYTHPTDALDALESPPLHPRVDAAAACLAIIGNLPGIRPMDVYNALFGVYQDCKHQNPGTHLDGRINKDGQWKSRWGEIFCLPTQRYYVPS